MKAKGYTYLGLITTFLLILTLIAMFPPTDDFNIDNPFWNGFSKLMETTKLETIEDVKVLETKLDAENYVLLIIGPSKVFNQSDVESIKLFLERGGKVVIMDDFGTGNTLLEGLNLKLRLSGMVLRDPLFRDKSSELPRVTEFGEDKSVKNVDFIQLNYATALEVADPRVSIVANSSLFSYLDLNLNGVYDKDEPLGPFPVIARSRLGKGGLLVVSDSSLFINWALSKEGNAVFLNNVTEDKKVILLTSYWYPSKLSLAKILVNRLYSFVGVMEFKYSLVLFTVMLIFMRARKERVSKKLRSIVDNVLKAHPTWERDLLERIVEEREKLGVGKYGQRA